VGVAIDTERGLCYWTQKGSAGATNGTLMCCNLDSPPAKGGVVTVLREGLETPIHICLRPSTKELLCVLRNPGEIVSFTLAEDGLRILSESVIVSGLLHACCVEGDSERLLFTELGHGGRVWASNPDGSNPKVLSKPRWVCAYTGVCAIELSSRRVCRQRVCLHQRVCAYIGVCASGVWAKIKTQAILAVAAVAVAVAVIAPRQFSAYSGSSSCS